MLGRYIKSIDYVVHIGVVEDINNCVSNDVQGKVVDRVLFFLVHRLSYLQSSIRRNIC